MSFTVSHAAAALPFYKSRLCFPAIVVGCMVPDFEYFIYFDYVRRGAHSLGGLFYFCVPVGLIILLLYYKIWRYLVADLCPDYIRNRLLNLNKQDFIFFPFKRFLIICLSLFLGAVLHGAWDLISHNFGLGPEMFPWLLDRVPYLHMHWWALFYAMGTLLGMILLMAAALVRIANTQPVINPPLRILPGKRVIAGTLIGGVIFAVIFGLKAPQYEDYHLSRTVAYFGLGVINYTMISFTIIGIWRRLKPAIDNLLPDIG